MRSMDFGELDADGTINTGDPEDIGTMLRTASKVIEELGIEQECVEVAQLLGALIQNVAANAGLSMEDAIRAGVPPEVLEKCAVVDMVKAAKSEVRIGLRISCVQAVLLVTFGIAGIDMYRKANSSEWRDKGDIEV